MSKMCVSDYTQCFIGKLFVFYMTKYQLLNLQFDIVNLDHTLQFLLGIGHE